MGSNKSGGPPNKAAPARATAKPQAQKQPAKKPAAKKPLPEAPTLVVEVDGKALALAEAEELWRAFSAHMDAHQGDLAGFAKSRGWKSVAPTYRRGSAVLLVTTTR